MSTGLFHAPRGLSAAEKDAGRTRPCVGDGTPQLAVPGLVKLDGVRIGNHAIQLTETRKFPHNRDKGEFVTSTWENFQLSVDDEDSAVLLRSICSNDGIWQKGVTFYITGEWSDAAVSVPGASDPAQKAAPAPRSAKAKAGAGNNATDSGNGAADAGETSTDAK